MPNNIMEYFIAWGPFAVLFAFLLRWVLATNREREDGYRREIHEMRNEHHAEMAAIRVEAEERSRRHHEVLTKFAEKYDLVISRLDDLKARLDGR